MFLSIHLSSLSSMMNSSRVHAQLAICWNCFVVITYVYSISACTAHDIDFKIY